MREVPRDNKWEQPEDPRDTDPAWPVEDEGEKGHDESPVEGVNDDPFSPENTGVVQTITLLRIYDVMLADFVERHPKAGKKLLERHARGGFLAPPPAFNPDEVEDYGSS